MTISDLQDKEDHQLEKLQAEKSVLPSNQKHLSLFSEDKKGNIRACWEERKAEQRQLAKLLAKENTAPLKEQVQITPSLYKGSCVPHKSIGDNCLPHYCGPQHCSYLVYLFIYFIAVQLMIPTFSIRVLFQNLFSKDIRLTYFRRPG